MTENEVYHTLGRVESKLDTLLESVKSEQAARRELDSRVQSLEHNRSWVKGGAWVISGVAGLFGVLIGVLFHERG